MRWGSRVKCAVVVAVLLSTIRDADVVIELIGIADGPEDTDVGADTRDK